MRILVGGVGSMMQYADSQQSFYELILRDGDERIAHWRDRGDYNRHKIAVEFLRRKEFDALYMMDLDMIYKPNCLERLRAHDKPMVTGHYFKRKPIPPESVVGVSSDGTWPFYPLEIFPDDGLYCNIGGQDIITAGFGNVLIKREVVEAVVGTLRKGERPFCMGPLPEMTNGDHGHFGADYLFFVRARQLGYKLWLDMHRECEPWHAATIWLHRDLYPHLLNYKRSETIKTWQKHYDWNRSIHGMNLKTLEAALSRAEHALAECQQQYQNVKLECDRLEKQELVIIGQVDALRQLIKEETETDGGRKLKLPVYESQEELDDALAARGKGPLGMEPEEVAEKRQEIYQREARDKIEAINDASSG